MTYLIFVAGILVGFYIGLGVVLTTMGQALSHSYEKWYIKAWSILTLPFIMAIDIFRDYRYDQRN